MEITQNTEMQIKYGGYQGFKAKFDFVMNKTASYFVEIGQMLKEARDTDILRGSGYSGMGDFAAKEYGLRPDQTSRFIAIAEKFGDGRGDLLPEYANHGYTKLSEMLTLPDAVVEAIPPELSREDIRTIKDEVQKEQETTPLEVMMEGDPEEEDELKAMLRAYFAGRPEDAKRAMRTMLDHENGDNIRDYVLEALEPSGVGVLQSRPEGMGRVMLTFSGIDRLPKLTIVRRDESRDVEWPEIWIDMAEIFKEMPAPAIEEETPEPQKEEKLKIAPAQTEEQKDVEAEKAEAAAGGNDSDAHGREGAGGSSQNSELLPESDGNQKTEVKGPLPEPQTPEPMNHSEPDPYKALRGSEEGRNCIVAIKTKAHNLETICKDAARLKADEERYMVQDLVEKFELEAQDMQKTLEEFLAVRLKEEAET